MVSRRDQARWARRAQEASAGGLIAAWAVVAVKPLHGLVEVVWLLLWLVALVTFVSAGNRRRRLELTALAVQIPPVIPGGPHACPRCNHNHFVPCGPVVPEMRDEHGQRITPDLVGRFADPALTGTERLPSFPAPPPAPPIALGPKTPRVQRFRAVACDALGSMDADEIRRALAMVEGYPLNDYDAGLVDRLISAYPEAQRRAVAERRAVAGRYLKARQSGGIIVVEEQAQYMEITAFGDSDRTYLLIDPPDYDG